MDFGLSNTIVRYVSKFRAENNKTQEQTFLTTCFLLYIIVFLFLCIISILLYYRLGYMFSNSLTTKELEIAKIMFLIMSLNIGISIPLNALGAIMTGYEQFVMPRILNIGRVVIRTVVLVLLLLMGYKSISIVILDTFLNCLLLLIYAIYVYFILRVRINNFIFSKPLLIEILPYTFYVFLNMVVDLIYWRIGQVVLGTVTNTLTVAVFSISLQFINYFMLFSTTISGVFLPKVTQMEVKNSSGEEMTNLLIKTGRIQLIVLSYILLLFLLFGKGFINLWIGPSYSMSWYTTVILMVSLTIPLTQHVATMILQAKNKHAFRSIMYTCIALFNILLCLILSKKYGAIGAATATAICLVLGNVIIINFYYYFKIGINIFRYFKELVQGIIIAVLVAYVLGLSLLLIPGQSWYCLTLQCIVFSLEYYIIIWCWGMNSYEKGLILKPFKKYSKIGEGYSDSNI